MLKRSLSCVVLFLVATVPVLRAAEPKSEAPTLIVRVQSFEQLLDNAKYLAALANQEEPFKQFEGLIKSMVGDKGLDGFDIKRPIALYGNLGGNLIDSSAVLMLPVSDEKGVLALLERFEIKPEKGLDGVYTVKKSDKLPEDIYFRFANKHVYATGRDKAALATEKLLAPEKIFVKAETAVVAVQFNIDQIPEGLKTSALVFLEQAINEAKEKNQPGETKEEHELKVLVLDEMFERVSTVINEGSEATLSFDVDRKTNDISLDLSLKGKKGSKLATGIANLAKLKSAAAGVLTTDSAMSMATRFTLPEKFAQALAKTIEAEMKKNAEKTPDKTHRELVEKFTKAIMPTIRAGELDTAFDLRGPNKKGIYTLLVAGGVEKGSDLESTLREIVKTVPQLEDLIKLDQDKAAGTAIHAINIPDNNEKFSKIFGDSRMFLALRDDAIFLAMGEDGLAGLKTALATTPRAAHPLQFELSLGRFGKIMEKDQPAAGKVIEEVFDKKKQNDRIRVSVDGGNALNLRFKMKADIIRFMVRLNEEGK
jgi:hypothetical protein